MASSQIERMQTLFNKMTTAQKKVFIGKLCKQLRGRNNPEYKKFLNECIYNYNTLIDDEYKKKKRTLIVLIILCSVAILLLGGFVIRSIPQYTASLSSGNNQSQTIAQNTVNGAANGISSTPPPVSEAGLTFLKAFPDANFRDYVLSTVLSGSKTDSDIISETDIATMAVWTDLDFKTQDISNLTGIEYFTRLTNSDSSSTSSTSNSATSSGTSSKNITSSSTDSSRSGTSSKNESSSSSKIENDTITISYDVKNGIESGTYTGELLNGKPNGQGTFKSNNSEYTYTGEWKNGVPNGQGVAYTNVSNGIGNFPPTWGTYRGSFSNGKPHGSGTFQGEVRYDEYNPPYEDVFTFVGTWKNGNRSGVGTETYPNGDILVGPYIDDTKNGYFKFTATDEQEWEQPGVYDVEIRNGVWLDNPTPR